MEEAWLTGSMYPPQSVQPLVRFPTLPPTINAAVAKVMKGVGGILLP